MKSKELLPEAALQFFRKQGRVGGLKRAKNMTPAERSEQARKAVQVRWAKETKKTRAKKGTK
jgi:hypothetical protein